MQSLTHFLRSSNVNLNSYLFGPTSFSDHDLLASVSLVSPQRRTRKLKKRTLKVFFYSVSFSAVEDFTLLRWHSGAQKRIGRAKQRDQIDNNEARLSWKTKSKQNIKAWLASLSCDSSRTPTVWSAIIICNIYFLSPSRTDKWSRNDTTVMIRPHVPNWHIGTSRHDPSRIDTSLATHYGSGVLDYREKFIKTNCAGGCCYLQVMSHKRFSFRGISCCH